jgi:excisionase family DNA binding protein
VQLIHNGASGCARLVRTGKTNISENICLNSIKDVVTRTRLSRSKIYEELANGRLKSVKVGRRRLISESALADYVECLVEAATPSGGAV